MHKVKTLKNGIRLISAPMDGTKTATILVMIGVGSRYETKKNNGISHFLEHMMFKGTFRRPDARTISSELDGIGGEFNAFTGKEYTGYWIKAQSSLLSKSADMLADMILNSKLEEKEIEREKGVILEEYNMYQDNPRSHIEDIFEECLYGNTPAGWDTIGTKRNISSFKRKDFLDYTKKYYGANRMVISLSGALDLKSEKLVEKYFSCFKKSSFKDKVRVLEGQKKPKVKLKYKKTDQAHLSLGLRGCGYYHKDKISLKILSVILGGSMSSRLFTSLREQNGLAYYVRTTAENYSDSGYLATQAGVPVSKIEKAIQIIMDEYKRIREDLVLEDELVRVKEMIKGRSAIRFESSDDMADWYAKQGVMGLGAKKMKIKTVEEYLKEIDKISAKDLKEIAQKYFKDKGLNLAVIGPYKNEKKFEKQLTL